ncbi:ABC transporter substrate-binding protein [Limnochorda pilosa]|uniref:ABC transporter substrate-binding protein n=1 Tax=Limnochorda pilosa TaxID=1555112 RepID=A0A0K2SN10_LIMPI|nr:extracellular solute-binding protein [Limnochorda pilosa]BAS28501.1 hypothetical protein LIP_2671 [Limnochorda pilosa]
MGAARRIVRARSLAPWIALALLALVGGTAGWYVWLRTPPLVVGDVEIRPNAPIDPQRTYRLELWEENVVLSGAGTTYRTSLEERVEAFRKSYPNVTVDVELFPPGEAADRLQAALASGRPPDIYGSLTPRLYDRTYQVPVERFLPKPSREGMPTFLPSAWHALSAEGHVWGWPRWVRFVTWAGHRGLLASAGLDVDRAAREGWTTPEALSVLSQVGEGRLPGLLVHPTAPDLFQGLMVAAGQGSVLEAGSLAWTREAMADAASFLLAARERARMPRSLDTAARERVTRFAQGRAGAIAPVPPQLAAHLLRTLSTEGLVLLPPPRPEGAPLQVPGEVSAYLVFRQAPYAGDGQTRLAMELARFLIQSKDAWVSAQFPAVPALTEDLAIWRDEAPWNEAAGQALLGWADAAAYASLDPAEATVEAQVESQVLAPALQELWTSNDAAAWAEKLRRTLEDQVPEPGG